MMCYLSLDKCTIKKQNDNSKVTLIIFFNCLLSVGVADLWVFYTTLNKCS